MNSTPLKIGVLGGGFDPPHLGHSFLASFALEEAGLDEVLWIPYHLPSHKDDPPVAAPAARLALCEAALAGEKRMRLDGIEIARGGVSYFCETLRELRKREPGAEYFLILGEDEIRDFARWRESEEVLAGAKILGFRRAGMPSVKEQTASVAWMEAPRLEISSRWIRARLAEGKSCHNLLLPAVCDYIRSMGLYLKKNPCPTRA